MVFRQLLHHWLRSQAHQAVRDKVQQAATDHLAEDRETLLHHSTDDPTCDVGIVFALEIEAGGLVDLLKQTVTVRGQGFKARRSTLRARRIVAVTSGAGQLRARRATESLIDAHRPRWVIAAGFAGGLSPALARHDLVVADSLVCADGQRLPLDLPIKPAALPEGIHIGPLLTVERIVRRPEEKRRLGEQFGALAVDTETAAVAQVCRERGVPLLAIRILTDAVDETLPVDIQHLTNQTTLPGQFGAALGAVWRRPKSVKDLWALKETALVASDRLAKFLSAIVERLAP